MRTERNRKQACLWLWICLCVMLLIGGASNGAMAAELDQDQDERSVYQTNLVQLTEEEQAAVQQKPVLRIMALGNAAPIVSYDEEGELVGISRKIMDHLSGELEVEFVYVEATTIKDMVKLVGSDQADLIIIPDNYAEQVFPDVPLTQPFLTADTALFYHDDLKPTELENKICAVVVGGSAPNGIPERNILYCENRLDAVEKVNSGEADYGYANAFSIAYYIGQQGFKHVRTLPVSDDTRLYCIGVLDGDPQLLSALDKAIATLDVRTMQTLVLEACVPPNESVTFRDLLEQFAVPIILCLLALLLVALFTAFSICMMNKRLKVQNTRLVTLAEISGDLLFEYDIDLDKLQFFKKFRETFQIPETTGVYDKTVIAPIIDLDSVIQRRITGEELCLTDGRSYRATYSFIQGNTAQPVYMIGKLVDISEEKAQLEQLSKQARLDGLTKILNSAESKRQVNKCLTHLPDGQVDALLILDVDDFKGINDTFGHYVGDQVLMVMAENLRHGLRNDDIVGRLGGDEFILYLKSVKNRENVERICNSLLERLQMPLGKDAARRVISVTIGVYLVTGRTIFEVAYPKADQALYRAKTNGKNRFYIYQGETQKPQQEV